MVADVKKKKRKEKKRKRKREREGEGGWEARGKVKAVLRTLERQAKE
jgi:hypothetical protein